MDLQQLEYFRTVARLGNMTKAAAELHIAQPSLSISIAKLEEELGAKLFDRVSGRIRLNQIGQRRLLRSGFQGGQLRGHRQQPVHRIADLFHGRPQRLSDPAVFAHSHQRALLAGARRSGFCNRHQPHALLPDRMDHLDGGTADATGQR